MTIVAAMTGGDADDMMVPGRNGVFYDRQGQDWHASVTKIVTNPISVRQAFWMPYKRIAKMVSDQVQKFAAEQDKTVDGKAAAGIAQTGKTVTAPAPAPAAGGAQPFDIAKFAGIFAALGLALGALGTALAAIVSGFLSLPVWKMPLVIAGVMLLISGPSMLLAWFKLRQRNLGPLLDANGWAVNIRARINIPFGGALTHVATLPAGAQRADRPLRRPAAALAALGRRRCPRRAGAGMDLLVTVTLRAYPVMGRAASWHVAAAAWCCARDRVPCSCPACRAGTPR
jgi:hypothetical protein